MRILLTLTLLLAPTLLADPEPRRAQRAPAKTAKARTLWGIKWYDSLDGARAVAAKDERKRKPVLWLRMLGDLAGKS